MSLRLLDVLTGARDRHPAFHKTVAPNRVLGRYMGSFEQRLINRASEGNPEAFAQQTSIIFSLAAANAVDAVAAGSAGALPVFVGDGGDLNPIPEVVGPAADLDLEGAMVMVDLSAATSATATSLTKTGAGWTVNAFVGMYAVVVLGTGAKLQRPILSNTADTLVISTGTDGQQWETIPAAGSLFQVLYAGIFSDQLGVVTNLPATSTRRGYLVKLTAAGVPYVDYAHPLVATFDVGIDLPMHVSILGGQVRDSGGGEWDLDITKYSHRMGTVGSWPAYIMGGKLFLIGGETIWRRAASIDIRYVPTLPEFSALTDYFLIGDDGYDVLTAAAALFMARRVNSLPKAEKVELQPFYAELSDAQDAYLAGITRTTRSTVRFVRSVW